MNKNKNKGFTLAELLIVVAIIGVLVAISIPIFTSQLEKAREATDAANIRSQYAEVMTEAITDGGDVDGKELFGAVELKQKKDQWQSSGLKENLEGVYQDVEGDYPKAGGTAWVEYKDDQAILHYEGGSSGSGSGNTGGGSTGGGTGGSTGGNTGGSTGGGSGSGGPGSDSGGGFDSGGDSGGGTDSGNSDISKKIESSCEVLPILTGDETFQVERGKIYSYQGNYYVALSTPNQFNQYYQAYPGSENGSWLYIQIRGDAEVLNSSSLVKKPDGSYELRNLKPGQLYETDDGSVYIRKGDSTNGVAPTEQDNNWQLIKGFKLK